MRNSQLIRIFLRFARPRARGRGAQRARRDLHRVGPRIAHADEPQGERLPHRPDAELKKKVTEAEQALQAFREREKIIDTKTLSQSGATKQVEELTTSLIEARRRRNEAEYAYQQVSALAQGKSQEALESIPAIQKHPQMLKLREAESEAEKRLRDASKRYGPEHPRMVAAESELKSARENARRGLAGAVQTVTREYESARANEAAIERTLNAAKGDIQNLNRKEFQLASLEREVATSRQFYDMFMQRYKETNISGEMHSPIARVVDPAIVPGRRRPEQAADRGAVAARRAAAGGVARAAARAPGQHASRPATRWKPASACRRWACSTSPR